MMKRRIVTLIALFVVLLYTGFAQQTNIYNPDADAKKEVKEAVELAAKQGKHVFLQIGGNWCPWCIKFHNFVDNDKEIKSYVDKNYVVVKVNYDQKNRNEELLSELGFPQRFGFPVFVILDSTGQRIHTQNSAFLEKDKNYDRDRVLRFYKNWSPTALNPNTYKK